MGLRETFQTLPPVQGYGRFPKSGGQGHGQVQLVGGLTIKQERKKREACPEAVDDFLFPSLCRDQRTTQLGAIFIAKQLHRFWILVPLLQAALAKKKTPRFLGSQSS